MPCPMYATNAVVYTNLLLLRLIDTLEMSWIPTKRWLFSRVHATLYVTMSVGPSVRPKSLCSALLFSVFWAERRLDLSYCPCPTTILPLPTRTRLMLPCIRPCLGYDSSSKRDLDWRPTTSATFIMVSLNVWLSWLSCLIDFWLIFLTYIKDPSSCPKITNVTHFFFSTHFIHAMGV